jgi:8-oxo-dGTP diphosphatase
VHWPGRRIGAAAFVLDPQEGVLLVRHTYGRLNWEPPGGASESGESLDQTAVRELREEAGMGAVAEQLVGIYYEAEHDAHHFVFRCRATSGEPTPSSEEVSDCRFWDPRALPRPISDFTVRRIEDALAETAHALPVPIPPKSWLD